MSSRKRRAELCTAVFEEGRGTSRAGPEVRLRSGNYFNLFFFNLGVEFGDVSQLWFS